MEYLEVINNYRVWIGRIVNKPGGGTGSITQVKECDGLGPDRETIEGIQVDGRWYPSETIISLNSSLKLPDEKTKYTSQGADGEDWIS